MSSIRIHLYGNLRKLAEKSGPTDISVLELEWKENETIVGLVNDRLKLSFEEVGEIFVNHKPICDYETIIPDKARVALFGKGMYLLCGGQHMKGHGFIEKKDKVVDYW